MMKLTKEAPKLSDSSGSSAPRGPLFPVVAIGASAGGLDPIVAFLSNVPQESGIAYVVIQHLDPAHKTMLQELLQRATSLPVFEIENRMPIRPDCIYVIPPNADLSVADGLLRLAEPAEPRGHRLPIDTFFSSLAIERAELAVGVVLSGMGTDGTRGLQAIKARNGLTLAQSPDTAKFDPMPQSAIAVEAVDLIELPEKMPGKIIGYLSQSNLVGHGAPLGEPDGKSALQAILRLLDEHTGNSFVDYKSNTVLRRIERRMNLHQLGTMAQYALFLRDNPPEIDLLFKELLIGVTNFFLRSESVGISEGRAAAAMVRRQSRWARLQGLGAGLFHRRRGVFAGHGILRGGRPDQPAVQVYAADLCHRPVSRRDRPGTQGSFSARHRQRRLGRAPRAFFY